MMKIIFVVQHICRICTDSTTNTVRSFFQRPQKMVTCLVNEKKSFLKLHVRFGLALVLVRISKGVLEPLAGVDLDQVIHSPCL